jgi:Zn-dependent M16 (insulinase) family peptidase
MPFLAIRTADDRHNCFSVALKTIPTDSSDVLHMLEHLTLRGSNSYPIRDLLHELEKGSYSTHVDACASPE